MKVRLAFPVSLVAGLLFAAAAPLPVPRDLERLEGEWVATEGFFSGSPEKVTGDYERRWTFKGDQLTISTKRFTRVHRVSLDPSKDPGWMDLTSLEGPRKGTVFMSIYKIEGDTLRVCMPLKPGARPEDFKTTFQNGNTDVTLKKIPRS